jgi:hypothetical protein
MTIDFAAPARLIFWPDHDGAIRGQDFPSLIGALAAVERDQTPRVHWIVTGRDNVIRPWHIASLLKRYRIRVGLAQQVSRSSGAS